MRSTEACYVNRTYVEALGYELPETLTWDFVWEVSEAAAAAKNADGTYTVNGQQVLLPFIYKSTDNMMIQLLRQKNAGYSTDSGDVQIFNDTTEDILYDVAPPHRQRRLLHLQDLRLPRQLSERGSVPVRSGLHRRCHMDGFSRAAERHQRRQVRGL